MFSIFFFLFSPCVSIFLSTLFNSSSNSTCCTSFSHVPGSSPLFPRPRARLLMASSRRFCAFACRRASSPASALGVFGRIWRRVFGREAGGRTVVPSSGILKVTNLESLRFLELSGNGEGMGLATWSSGFGSSPGLGSARGLDVLLTVRFLA